jgi:diguanylate cyclase (GGDEF)-like protein
LTGLILAVLIIFTLTGFLLVRKVSDYYYQERIVEATTLAKSFSQDIATVLDASELTSKMMDSKLRSASKTLSDYEGELTRQKLKQFSEYLEVDVIYKYNTDLVVVESSDGEYLGWQPEEDHPIRTFYESGEDSLVEAIRPDTVSGIFYKYGYAKSSDGSLIQIGILATTIQLLNAKLNPQYILDKISQDVPNAKMNFITKSQEVYSPSGTQILIKSLDDTILEGIFDDPNALDNPVLIHKELQQLTIVSPVVVENQLEGVLAIEFDMQAANSLVASVSMVISATLCLLFCSICIFSINIFKKNKRISKIAYFNELTGLPNSLYFFEEMKRTWDTRKLAPQALLIVNPINFKLINNIYGYSYGDTLLKQIAFSLDSLSSKILPIEMQAYRFSDDRFILTCRNFKDTRELEQLCNKILAMQLSPGLLGTISFSIGVLEILDSDQTLEKALKEVSIALGNTTALQPLKFYNASMGDKLMREEKIVQELKSILAGAPDLFYLMYQPIVSSDDCSIQGFEALARLTSKTLGPISPVEFIDIAEKNQLIIPLGQKILELALGFLKELQKKGYTTQFIAVNVSALQLLEESFVSTLIKAGNSLGVNLKQLELEITESVFSDNLNFIEDQLNKIHRFGINVALDDFGTGYSSLSRLEGWTIDSIKFDKQFVDRLIEPTAVGIAEDIVSMVHHLGKTLTAEGIERESQRLHLKQMGCDRMQGYLFSKPLMPEVALQKLQAEEEKKIENSK